MRIGVIAALPGELKPLVKRWRRVGVDVRGARMWTLTRGEDTWVAACAGMGVEAARRAFALAELGGPLDLALSVGWAGSLDEAAGAGSVHVPAQVIDAQTGERFALSNGDRNARLVTTARVVDAKEKARLAATYPGAVLVDMEAATVARLAEIRNVPWLCVKGVSDAMGAELPDMNPFIDAMGQMKMLPFLAHIACRPKYWPALLHLGRNSARAAENMRDLIQEFMKEKNVEKLIGTGRV
ncbi:nucleoside phosphorylase [Edaphobacter sp.]|uniref:5'-methylthioadenosine/S-adenosylhomocysteine nucleosidase family protein n=1 Tax=Edaphobacter sp. TaxID=1934404 RepID=UPI002DBB4E33|nr:nucleoside phosphorylase [Edaphobacter sp.]HEU5340265.1 nucleoside phosphorylase [Edaphobacter sp.]